MLRNKPRKQRTTFKPKRAENVAVVVGFEATKYASNLPLCESTQLFSSTQEPNIKGDLIKKYNKNVDMNFSRISYQQTLENNLKTVKPVSVITEKSPNLGGPSHFSTLRHGVAKRFTSEERMVFFTKSVWPIESCGILPSWERERDSNI
ncbi:unnamed protein product [Ceratitis capitata]|uniref:(Mediterranean fruit fly) hypothetical protein n=1 Tax=Ceratitis capitata TaxID=7213 RepID=A0A811UCC3_CERCA|nr:unnamed protein product [Ceratitis capitata]